jgi:DNA-binding response OmpR family regulator
VTTRTVDSKASAIDTVVLVEDDHDVRETTQLVLERHGFLVRVAADGNEGYARSCEPGIDIAVVDIAMPGMDGLSLTKLLVKERRCPVILLTARDLASDIVGGLDIGADDYLTKPFEGQVLAARIRTVLRRTRATRIEADRLGELTVDRAAMTVYRGDAEVSLSVTEFRILTLLLDRRGAVLSRRQILAHVWGDAEWGAGRVVDVNVQRLRAKLGTEDIVTVRGAGYKIPHR